MKIPYDMKQYKVAELRRALRELGFGVRYLSELRKSEVVAWIKEHLDRDDQKRVAVWIRGLRERPNDRHSYEKLPPLRGKGHPVAARNRRPRYKQRLRR
jgi:hypothetical protein